MKTLRYASALLAVAALASPAGAQEWRPLGPFGGRVVSLAVDPFSPSVVLAGSALTGFYRSANRGGRWRATAAPVLEGEVRVIAFDPRNPGVVYAATTGSAVLKSSDHGRTWEPVAAGLPGGVENTPVHALAVDPRRSSNLYAAVSGGTGLYRSADGGASWSPLTFSGVPGIRVLAVDSFGVVWAGTDGGVFNSRDRGASWQRSRIERPGIVFTIALAPDAMFIGTGARGIFKSTDRGATWSRLGGVVANRNVSHLAVDPRDASILYAALVSDPGRGLPAALLRSVDGGAHWSSVSRGLPREDILSLAIDPAAPSRIYAGLAESGVFRSSNVGRRWVEANRGLDQLLVTELAADPARPGTLWAGPTRRGLFRTLDGGGSWELVNDRLRGPWQIDLALDPAGAAYASAGGFLERSDDGGRSWTKIDGSLRRAGFLGPIASRPRPPAILYASTVRGIFRSADRGESWQAPANGFECLAAEEIAASPAAPEDVYASALSLTSGCNRSGGAFKSTDGGVSWTRISVEEPVGTLRPHPAEPDVVYALGAAGVLRSDDGGLRFAPVGQPPIEEPAILRDLAIDPFRPDTLYLATVGRGVFVSDDGGVLWEPLGEGLEGIPIRVLRVDPAVPGRIWAGTARGVFVLDRAPSP